MSADISPLGAAALDYVNRGLAVIPLAPGEKVPATSHGIKDWSDNPEQIKAWWGAKGSEIPNYSNPNYNIGVVCGEESNNVFVIDIDVHGDVDGRKTLKEWEILHGDLPETCVQITGGGGLQYFYRSRRKIKPSANGKLGIDVRGQGSYCVVPPSLHPSGDYYEWSVSLDDCDIADADDQVYSFLDYIQPNSGDEPKELFSLPEVIGENRNDTLFRYASSLREKGLDEQQISVLVRDANNTRCYEPLPEKEINSICGSVKRYEPGNKAKKAKAIEIESGEIEKAKRLEGVTSLEVCQLMLNNESIANGIKFDVIDQRPWKVAPLPWDKTEEIRPIIDGDISSMYGVLEYCEGIRSMSMFRTALNQFMMIPSQRINPIDDVIATLPPVEIEWGDDLLPPETCTINGKEEITFAGNLFKLLLNSDDNEYTREVELLMLRQLVARAFHPGCKADSMVVLAGAQGIGKSTFAKELALDTRFFLDGMSKFDEEHKRRLIGKLVVEVSELEAFNHSDMSSIKQAITAQRDNIRMPYKEFAADYPRTCIFIGTTNEGAFLTDTTGNRRFLPIVCNQPSCDANPMLFDGTGRMMIRQAIAETVALYRKLGDEQFLKTLVLPKRVMNQAIATQQAYTQEDDILTAVSSYLETLPLTINRVNVKKVMVEGMDYSKESFSKEKRYVKADVARALDKCEGWRKEDTKNRVHGFGVSQTWIRTS